MSLKLRIILSYWTSQKEITKSETCLLPQFELCPSHTFSFKFRIWRILPGLFWKFGGPHDLMGNKLPVKEKLSFWKITTRTIWPLYIAGTCADDTTPLCAPMSILFLCCEIPSELVCDYFDRRHLFLRKLQNDDILSHFIFVWVCPACIGFSFSLLFFFFSCPTLFLSHFSVKTDALIAVIYLSLSPSHTLNTKRMDVGKALSSILSSLGLTSERSKLKQEGDPTE